MFCRCSTAAHLSASVHQQHHQQHYLASCAAALMTCGPGEKSEMGNFLRQHPTDLMHGRDKAGWCAAASTVRWQCATRNATMDDIRSGRVARATVCCG